MGQEARAKDWKPPVLSPFLGNFLNRFGPILGGQNRGLNILFSEFRCWCRFIGFELCFGVHCGVFSGSFSAQTLTS